MKSSEFIPSGLFSFFSIEPTVASAYRKKMTVPKIKYLELFCLLHGRHSMIGHDLQGHTLLSNGFHCGFIHRGIVDAHATEYGKCLQ